MLLENTDIGIDVSIGIGEDIALGIPIDAKLLRIVLMHVGTAFEWFVKSSYIPLEGLIGRTRDDAPNRGP